LPGGMYGFLIVINLAVFLLAFFLDFFELAFIIVPLLKPAAEAIFRNSSEAVAIAKGLGLAVVSTADSTGALHETVADVAPFMIWFGVLLAINMQTSFMHPPFGFALFYLRSVAPKEPYSDKVTGQLTAPVTTGQIYWGAVPYVGIQLLMVGLIMMLPGMVIKTKVGAPPPPVQIEAPIAPKPADGIPGQPVAPPASGRLALPPTPPLIEGAAAPDESGPGAPVLDLSVPPDFGAASTAKP
jgi:hypothetical protein